jgi:hypothetical protein
MIYDSFDSPMILNFVHVMKFFMQHMTYEGRIFFLVSSCEMTD